MNHYLLFVYGVCFSIIGGAACAMMWANIKSISEMNTPIKSNRKRHPEAPEEGEEVMYVDLSRERLEDLYKQEKD